MSDFRKKAYYLRDLGINVVPLKVDGSKLPSIYWKHLQTSFITDSEIEEHCLDCGGLAAITGGNSKLFCIDFDLNKQLISQDYWNYFMLQVPKELKKKMLINQTRSGGYHVWGRTDFVDKSRKLTHRSLTIEELYERYKTKIDEGYDPTIISKNLLNNPVECVIETRFEGSYGVISHPSYKRFYGEQFNWFTEEEVQFLYNVAYELDYRYRKASVYKGEVGDYKIMIQYNEDTTSPEVVEMMVGTGLYEYNSVNSSGDILLKRVGSTSPHSCKVFCDTGVIHEFGTSNIFTDGKQTHNPFELYCALNDLSEQEAIEKLKK